MVRHAYCDALSRPDIPSSFLEAGLCRLTPGRPQRAVRIEPSLTLGDPRLTQIDQIPTPYRPQVDRRLTPAARGDPRLTALGYIALEAKL